jgi:hypothetical protein
MGLAERAAEDGEVLAEDEHQAAVDHAVAGDNAVAADLVLVHAEVGTAVLDEHVPLLKRAFVEQQFQPLARGELALGVLRGNALGAAAQAGLGAHGLELLLDVMHGEGLLVRESMKTGRAGGAPRQTPRPRAPPARRRCSGAARCVTAGWALKRCFRPASMQAPHPGLVLLLAARGQPAVGRLQACGSG